MSTSVPMPVRVKPPPAEFGEIISPGWASLVVITPEKGARMTVSSTSWRRAATSRAATSTCWRPSARRAANESASASAASTSFWLLAPPPNSRCCRCRVMVACRRRTSFSSRARCACTSWASASASAAPWVLASRRASSCPSRTSIPSSISTSATLPVTFEETVAWRRAVT